MRAFAKKISAFLMAVVVLTTTTSFTVNLHFCGSTLIDYALLASAKGCGMNAQAQQALSSCETQLTQKSCCSDEKIIIEGQEEVQKQASQELPHLILDFEAPQVFSLCQYFPLESFQEIAYAAHAPPPSLQDRIVLYGQFRI